MKEEQQVQKKKVRIYVFSFFVAGTEYYLYDIKRSSSAQFGSFFKYMPTHGYAVLNKGFRFVTSWFTNILNGFKKNTFFLIYTFPLNGICMQLYEVPLSFEG